jgi:hypothetical protein
VLKKSRRSAAVGHMCRVLLAHLTLDVDYPGRGAHAGHLIAFLEQCLRIKWQADDLRSAVEFLALLEHEKDGKSERTFADGVDALATELIAKGRGRFPDNAFFQLKTGQREIALGPVECDRQLARSCFERVLELTQGKSDAESVAWAKDARMVLELLNRHGGPLMGAMGPPDEYDEDDADDEDGDACYEDDEEDGVPAEPFGFRGRFSPESLPKDTRQLFDVFAAACRAEGLDPLDVIDRAAQGMPFRLPTGGVPAGRGRPKKRKRKA